MKIHPDVPDSDRRLIKGLGVVQWALVVMVAIGFIVLLLAAIGAIE